MTIEELREQGYKVKVTHLRRFGKKLLTKGQANAEGRKWTHKVRGETIVSILTPEGKIVDGLSRCRNSDPFTKRVGIDFALTRALSLLQTMER